LRKQEEIATLDLDLQEVEVRFTVQTDQALEVFLVLHLDHRRDLQEMFLVLQDLVLETIQAQDLQQDQAPGQVRDLQEMFLAPQDLVLEIIQAQGLVTEVDTHRDHQEELFIEVQHKEEPVTIEVIIIDQIGTDPLLITTHTTTHIIPVYLIIDLIGHPREDILTHFLTLQFIGTLG